MKKQINKSKLKYLIPSLCIIVFTIILGSTIYYRSYFKIGFSFKFLFLSIIEYFKSLFHLEANSVYSTFDLIKDVNEGTLSSSLLLESVPSFALPLDIDLFNLYLKESFFMSFHLKTFISYISNFLNIFNYIQFISLFIILIICLKIFMSSIMFNCIDPLKIENTKAFKRRERFENKVIDKIKKYLKEFYRYNKEKNLIKLEIFLILFYLNGVSIVIDLFAYFFLFSASFSLSLIIKAFISTIYLMFPILMKTNLLFWIIVIYIFINNIRKRNALNKLIKLESNNLKFCDKNLGIVNLFDGLMGGYKTSTITDFALTTSKLYRFNLNDNLYKYRSYLPYFNFSKLEKYVEFLANNEIIYNHAQLEILLENRFKVADNSLTLKKDKYYFGYDFNKYKDYYWSGVKKISVKEILIEYAKNYFYFSCPFNYIYSTYPIKTIEKTYSKGYYPEYDCHYFFIDEDNYDLYSSMSHVLNLNEIRIKKYNEEKIINSLLSFGVVAYSEAEKDLGNQISNREYKKDDLNANPNNDGTDLILKMIRHVCSLNYKPYIKFFLDMQRFGDLASKYKDISTSLIRCIKVEEKTTLKFYDLETVICEWIIKLRKDVDKKMKNTRNRFGYIYYLFNKLTTPFESYFNKNKEKYSYKKLTLLVKGREEDEGEEFQYNLFYAKTFADSYRTDSHYSLFKKVMSKSKKGIYSGDSYNSLNPDMEEMKEIHSYFNDKLSGLFNENLKDRDNDERNNWYE